MRCGTLTGLDDHYTNGTPVCDDCQRAHNRWQNRYRMRVEREGLLRIPAVGTHRRIQALAFMGHSHKTIADAAGKSSDRCIGNILARELVHRDTAALLDDVYRRLCMTPGRSRQTASRARAKGWLGPLAWDDIDNPDEEPDRSWYTQERRRADDRRRWHQRKGERAA